MTTIWERAYTALATLGLPLGQSQYISASPAALPDQFIVFSLVTGVDAQAADDAETARRYRVQVSLFSRSGLVGLPNVNAAMIAAKFQKGPERELPYDEKSRHFGLAKDYFYLEEE